MTIVHVIAPFHTRLVKEKWSHCGFTQMTLKQIEVFKRLGTHVIDYSNYGSESTAHEHVELLDTETFHKFFTDDGVPGSGATIGSTGWTCWDAKLAGALIPRVQEPGDHIVVHAFGDPSAAALKYAPQASHLESQVGYDRPPFGAKRVYASNAWRHFMWGKYPNDVGDRRYSWVIPSYYDVNDWPEANGTGDYIAFMSRVIADKGMSTIQAIAKAKPEWQFKIAGTGDIKPFEMPSNVEYMGTLPGNARAGFIGDAAVQILPTEYIEPCGGSLIEGMLCGTPAVASSWGGFTETVEPGVTGYHASTLQEWIDGIEAARGISRAKCAARARERYSLDAAAKQFGRVFEQLLSLKTPEGWYSRTK